MQNTSELSQTRGRSSTAKNWRMWSAILVALVLLVSLSSGLFAQSTPEPEEEAETTTEAVATPETTVEAEEVETTQDDATAEETAVEEPGVLIVAVQADSPAAAAGLTRGDIILSINGEPMDTAALVATITGGAVGDTLTVEWQHGAQLRTDDITLGDQDGMAFLGVRPHFDGTLRTRLREHVPGMLGGMMEGMMYGMMPEMIQGAGPRGMMAQMFLHHEAILQGVEGLVVVEVMADSPAAAAGLATGDIITAVAGEPITTTAALQAIVEAAAAADTLTLDVVKAATLAVEADATDEATEELTIETVTVTLAAHADGAETAYLGVRVALLQPQLRLHSDARPGARGMMLGEGMLGEQMWGKGMMEREGMERGGMEDGMRGGRHHWQMPDAEGSDEDGDSTGRMPTWRNGMGSGMGSLFAWGMRMWQSHMGTDGDSYPMFRFFMNPDIEAEEALPFSFPATPRSSDFF